MEKSLKSTDAKQGQWGAETRELAYELYALVAGRQLAALERILASAPYELPVPYQTLWYWQRADRWDIRADEDAAKRAPALRTRTLNTGDAIAFAAVAEIQRVLAGAQPADKDRTPYLKLALEAGGVIGSRAMANKGGLVVTIQSEPTAALTNEDRAALAAKLDALTESTGTEKPA